MSRPWIEIAEEIYAQHKINVAIIDNGLQDNLKRAGTDAEYLANAHKIWQGEYAIEKSRYLAEIDTAATNHQFK